MEDHCGGTRQNLSTTAAELAGPGSDLGYASGLANVQTVAGLSYCAFCQMPLNCLAAGESVTQHVTRCQVTTLTVQHLLPECPAGVGCSSVERSHYVRFSHLALTKLRLYEASMLSSFTSDSSVPPESSRLPLTARSLSAVASSYLDHLQQKSRDFSSAPFKTTDASLASRHQLAQSSANMYGTLTVSLTHSPRHSLASTSPVMSSPMPSQASAVTTSSLTFGRISPSSVDLLPRKRGRANTMSPPRRPGSSRLLATPHSTNMTSNHMASVSDINPQLPAPDARAERPRSGSFSVLSSGVRSSTGIGSDWLFKKRALCAQSASGYQRNQYAHRHGFNIADIISSDPADPPIADQSTALDLSVHSTGDGWKSRPRSATESWVSGRSASATAAAAAHYRLRKAPAPAEPAAITTGDSSKTAVESALVPITCSESVTTTGVKEGVDISPTALPPSESAKSSEITGADSVTESHPPKKRRFTSPAIRMSKAYRPELETITTSCPDRQSPLTAADRTTHASYGRDQQMAPLARLRADSKPVRCFQRKCPPFKLVTDTPFAVDAFSYGLLNGVSVYFLSHFHFDHYRGLSANSVHPVVYCSQVTGNLVKNRLHVSNERLRCLTLNEPHIIEDVQVTLLDANHCPGAVMFLFKLGSGVAHLHVGDFRADPAMESYAELWNTSIDRLYLDTTYCDPSCDFISQQESLLICERLAIAAIQKHPRTLIVCGSYFIGKEKVYGALADRLNCMIWVSAEKRSILQCLNVSSLTNRLTTDQMLARVHVLPLAHISFRTLQSYLLIFQSQYSHLVAFKPTSRENSTAKQTSVGNVSIYSVPYSEHSSYSELRRFVQFIQPKQVIPTIGGSSGGNNGGSRNKHSVDDIISGWLAGDNSDNKPASGDIATSASESGAGPVAACDAGAESASETGVILTSASATRINEEDHSAEIQKNTQSSVVDDAEASETVTSSAHATSPVIADNTEPRGASRPEPQGASSSEPHGASCLEPQAATDEPTGNSTTSHSQSAEITEQAGK